MEGPTLPAAGARPGVGPDDIAPFGVKTLDGAVLSEEGLAFPPGNPDAVEVDGVPRDGLLAEAAAAMLPRGGADKFVHRLMMSFPCTTRLSLDFLRSRVSISVRSGNTPSSVLSSDKRGALITYRLPWMKSRSHLQHGH